MGGNKGWKQTIFNSFFISKCKGPEQSPLPNPSAATRLAGAMLGPWGSVSCIRRALWGCWQGSAVTLCPHIPLAPPALGPAALMCCQA